MRAFLQIATWNSSGYSTGEKKIFLSLWQIFILVYIISLTESFDLSAGKEPAKGASAERAPDFLIELQYVSFSAELAKRKKKKMTTLLRASCL